MDLRKAEDLQLGQTVAFMTWLQRKKRILGPGEFASKRNSWEHIFLKEKQSGIFLGLRTLSEGRVHYSQGSGYEYTPERHWRVALVVYDARINPVYVPLDMMEIKINA